MRFRSGALLVLAALVLAPARGRAYWIRQEWIGYHAETGRFRLRGLDFAAYESTLGLGAGTALGDMWIGAWDVRRSGRPDASAHTLVALFPIRAYVALWSWAGPPYFHVLNRRVADQGIGRLELFGSYCGWGALGNFDEADFGVVPSPGFEFQRTPVSGSLKAKIKEYGVRLDFGAHGSLQVGRLEFDADADPPFRARSFGRWYGSASLFFGATTGTDHGGGLVMSAINGVNWLRGKFGADVVHPREPEPWPSKD